jgi:hypothetical protein
MRLFEITAPNPITQIYSQYPTFDELITTIGPDLHNLKSAIWQYKKGNAIFRGIGRDYDGLALIARPSSYNRPAANTTNFTNAFVSGDSSWSAFPKRNNSLICTTGLDGGYGNTYVVLPFGDPMIGICPDADFWISFRKTLRSNMISSFNRTIVKMMSATKRPDMKFDSYPDVVAGCKEIEHEITIGNIDTRMISYELFGNYKPGDSFLEYIRDILDPSNNDFELRKLSTNFDLDFNADNEVWTSADCLLINKNNADIIIDKLSKMMIQS